MTNISLDELDRRSFGAMRRLAHDHGEVITLATTDDLCSPTNIDTPMVMSLCGRWEFAEDGAEDERLGTQWADKFFGQVPCGVHKALFDAGKIPDPNIGKNQILAREHSFHVWWLRREFTATPQKDKRYQLCFEGIADRCTIWLNGTMIAKHQGMFGGPDIEVTDLLQEKNTITVKLEPIPFKKIEDNNADNNGSWRHTVVINNVYGWHYSNLPSLGIWQPVILREIPPVELRHPFIFTRNAAEGRMGLVVFVHAQMQTDETLSIDIRPLNFDGIPLSFKRVITVHAGNSELHYEFTIPQPHLWWPNDFGEQNLYVLTVTLGTDVYRHQFGIRTIEMAPLPGGAKPDLFDWQFIINDKRIFVTGTGWCTADALLDLSRERYDRFLSLAHSQHIRMMRAWGCGLPETDDFYELCDKYGIMIMQEWPTAWDSHNEQPSEILEETVQRHTLRLRNYPSLIMYGAGNESPEPFGNAIDMMGRMAEELDGTRPFHRGEPWGGSKHDYASYWGGEHLDHHLTATAPFWGEFGFASMPCFDSVMRYLPQESRNLWPPEKNPDLIHHTPIFGYANDMERLKRCAEYFLPHDYTMREFITASQFAQALGVRRVLERARTRYPDCTGVLYYKMNDNCPAASWASVDWYGVPKIGHYVFQDSFEPLHACVLFDHCDFARKSVTLPIFLLDDKNELPAAHTWQVIVQAYNADLKLIREQTFSQMPTPTSPYYLGDFVLSKKETNTAPLFVICDIITNTILRSRAFYFCNFESTNGGLFRLPKTTLSLTIEGTAVMVTNTGTRPAVAVMLTLPEKEHIMEFSDNFLWLNPGETNLIKTVGINTEELTTLTATAINSNGSIQK